MVKSSLHKVSEVESWGELTKDQFTKFRRTFSKQFGKPRFVRRLAISYWNPDGNKKLDTRIRITNGTPQIVQKFGDWENARQSAITELTFSLPKDAGKIFTIYTILHNNIQKEYPDKFIQLDNYIFKTKQFELKLSRQFGKSNKYSFEVELLDRHADLEEILNSLGLDNLVKKTNVDFWRKWDSEVNWTERDLNSDQVVRLIGKYLTFK